jgi:chromate transport protein ChrA
MSRLQVFSTLYSAYTNNRDQYQELFGVSQALSGPASTKMLYCINLIHGGFLQALLAFLIWR